VQAVGNQTEMGQSQAYVLSDRSITVVSVFQQKNMLVVKCTISFLLVLVIAALLVQGFAHGDFFNGKTKIKQAILSALSIIIAAIPIDLPLAIQQ
jgi:magnesium-transporting ATPase (P-type)